MRRAIGILIASAILAVGCSSGLVTTGASADEVFLEPAAATGENPFTASISERQGDEPGLEDAGDPAIHPAGEGIRSTYGSEPGLYGGSNSATICDTEQLVAFLDAEPEKAAAWSSVLGIEADEIGEYVAALTPVILRVDTRVTNHGFHAGRATPRQAVLQAGTAVLVDAYGVPRVRCACGNPLVEPEPVEAPDYVGVAWEGFSPNLVVVVVAGDEVTHFVCIDVDTGDSIDVDPGTQRPDDDPNEPGQQPVDPDEPGQEPDDADGPAEETPITSPETGSFMECAQQYGQLVAELGLGVNPDQAAAWAEAARQAAELYGTGQESEAAALMCDTVAEMWHSMRS